MRQPLRAFSKPTVDSMSVWRQLTRGMHALTNRAAADRNVADEVDDYLENARAAHLARGLSPDDALRAARIEVGGVANVREQVRGYGWENAVELILADRALLQRNLERSPQLIPLERRLAAITFYDNKVPQLDAFERGEPAPAIRTAAPPAHSGVFFSRPAVLYD